MGLERAEIIQIKGRSYRLRNKKAAIETEGQDPCVGDEA